MHESRVRAGHPSINEPSRRATVRCRHAVAAASALSLAAALAACSTGDDNRSAPAHDSVVAAAPPSIDKSVDNPVPNTSLEPSSDEATEHDAAVETVELAMIDCGEMEVVDLGAVPTLEDTPDREVTLAVTCWLVTHPDGILLWDLGAPTELAGDQPKRYFAFDVSLDHTISDQLPALGLGADDVDFVSVSHTHFDHVGQVDQFPNATWLVHEAELTATAFFGPEAAFFRALDSERFTGELDVFGDGTVVIFETPGHTPGHTSLQVTLAEAGTILLSGDLYVTEESREHQLMPPFTISVADTLKSMEEFELRAEELGARVVITHDFESIGDLPRPPDVLR